MKIVRFEEAKNVDFYWIRLGFPSHELKGEGECSDSEGKITSLRQSRSHENTQPPASFRCLRRSNLIIIIIMKTESRRSQGIIRLSSSSPQKEVADVRNQAGELLSPIGATPRWPLPLTLPSGLCPVWPTWNHTPPTNLSN